LSHIRVLLADDHTLVRTGIRALLTSFEDITVVAEASDGREALGLIQQHRPHVALLDISMPEMNCIDVVAQTTKTTPSTRTIILSVHASEEYVHRALQAGAVGYILKDADSTEFEMAVRAVARGQTYLSPAVSRYVIEGYVHPSAEPPSALERLTPRHREILQLIAEGHTTKEIARRLKIGIRTVEAHRAELMRRLDIHDIAGLVRFAVRVGLVSPDR
jgi:DNA-binding NarL/FixJ family response regulator